jgi:hypothetical protein
MALRASGPVDGDDGDPVGLLEREMIGEGLGHARRIAGEGCDALS